MKIEIQWHQPLKLIDGSNNNLILNIEELFNIHEGAGVYMFCRIYDSVIYPLYIGKSINVQKRIGQHLNSVKMMLGIQNSQRGDKVLIIGEFISKPGQQIEKAIGIIETALIEHALQEGHDLLNDSGTKRPTHQLTFKGYMAAKKFSGGTQRVKA